MTIITQLNLVSAPPGAPTIQIPSVEEINLMQDPALAARWIARQGYADSGAWPDDKFGISGLLRRNAWPTYTTGGINDRPYLQFHPTNTAVIVAGDGGENLWPSSGAFSLSWVAAPTAASFQSQQTIFAVASSDTNTLARIGYNNDGQSILVRNGAFVIANYNLGGVPSAQHVVYSYDYSDQSWVLYINGASVMTGSNGMSPPTNRLSLFGGVPLEGSGIAAAGFNGQFYEGLVYSGALHKRPDSIATLNTYISAVYGL